MAETLQLEDYDKASHFRVLKDILSDGDNYHRVSPTDRGTALIAWASSIAAHFRMEQRSPGCHIQGPAVPEQQIGSSIADFLDIVNDRLRETSKSDFVNPALLALVSVLDALTPSGTMVFSPTLDHVVNTRKWSPDALWLTLASTQELVEKQLLAIRNIVWNEKSTPRRLLAETTRCPSTPCLGGTG